MIFVESKYILKIYTKIKKLLFIFQSNRAINGQALVGNIGGYLGLFLGYSILQLPGMIEIVAKKIKNWHLWMMISRDNAVKEILYPVTIGEDAFGEPSDTKKEKSGYLTSGNLMEARIRDIEQDIKNVTKTVSQIQQAILEF